MSTRQNRQEVTRLTFPLKVLPGKEDSMNMRICIITFMVCLVSCVAMGDALDVESIWKQAEANGAHAQKAVAFSRAYAHGWLSYADPASGLLPRTIYGDEYWNAQDCAADNFPFIVLTANILDDYYLKQTASTMLETERRLTTRVDGLPDTYDFAKQGFLEQELNWNVILFGASEYVKDGLMPITEWMGPTPWEDRMLELLYGIWKHAEEETPAGLVPTNNLEVHGELLQSMSRMYWRTGDERFKTWCFRLADLYLLHDHMLDHEQIRLRDHGCEVISGLSEAYFIAAREDLERHVRYRKPFHAILDDILEHAVNKDGMMPNTYRPRSSKRKDEGISDGWGYVYNAYLTVAEIDGVPRYREAVRHALENIHKYLNANWEGHGADGYADSVEGALNLLNRIPVESAFDWVDKSIRKIWELQRDDGIIEGWYGDGNSARTSLMYALWKTQGVAAAPWRDDLRLGAVMGDDGTLYIHLHSSGQWTGVLRFDHPRHKNWFNLPSDYPRINQFPEWFTIKDDVKYRIQIDENAPLTLSGDALRSFPLRLKPDQTVRLIINKKE